MELLILTIPIFGLFLGGISLGRFVEARQATSAATTAAAESLAVGRGGPIGTPQSTFDAEQAAAGILKSTGLKCVSGAFTSSVSPEPESIVTVHLTCTARAASTVFAGWPGSVTLTASGSAPLLPLRSSTSPRSQL